LFAWPTEAREGEWASPSTQVDRTSLVCGPRGQREWEVGQSPRFQALTTLTRLTSWEGFDKHQPTYCGGAPHERPEDVTKRVRDLANVPTIHEVAAAFAEWLEEFHATTHTGDADFLRLIARVRSGESNHMIEQGRANHVVSGPRPLPGRRRAASGRSAGCSS